ncbi:OFA family MFS transporter [uncultured Ilyobacter sp.]|uniref:L-lactate MFS transporter n=1 Tax=uncultured Ilyobacter sp. TaxID=544433 RepID=UPI0029C6E94E|nr:OFA family MFS transporter [uncultured Ilyobacter sp.]
MKKRELYIVNGLIMFLCMGTIYSWGVFQKPLVEALRSVHGVETSPIMASMPYTVFLLFYAFSMPVVGLFIKKTNPKIMAVGGSIAISVGWILAGSADSINFIIATYGVIGGIGVGTVYGVLLAVVAEWFPDKKGFAVGLTLLGFGLSPFITAPLASTLIEIFGVFPTFKILGVAFAVILSLLSLNLKFPENKIDYNQVSNHIELELTPSQMMKTPTFYALWTCFAIGTFSGLMIIGLSSTYAQEVMYLTPIKAAFFTSFFAIFNGIGRPLFGTLIDKLGTKNTITLSYSLIITAGILSILFKGNVFIFGLAFSIMWLNLGGWLAIAPASTFYLFGKSHYSANYGVLFTAYGIGALSQGFVGGFVKEAFGSYLYVFYPVVAMCLLGLIVSNKFIKAKTVDIE